MLYEVTKMLNALPGSVSSNLPLLASPDLTEEELDRWHTFRTFTLSMPLQHGV